MEPFVLLKNVQKHLAFYMPYLILTCLQIEISGV